MSILIVTADPAPEGGLRIMTALFDGQVSAYLTKPPNKAELLHKLETLGLL